MNPPPFGPGPSQHEVAPQYSLPPKSGGGFSRGLLGWVLFVGLAVMLFFLLRNKTGISYTEVPLNDFYRLVREGKVQSVTIEDAEVRGRLSEGMQLQGAAGPQQVFYFRTRLPPGMGTKWEFNQWVLENAKDARVEGDTGSDLVTNILVPLIPWALIFGFIWFFVFRQLRAHGARPQQPLPVYLVNAPPPGPGPANAPPLPSQSPPQPPGA